ncbi:hypothetical protein ABW21_db0204340 [Orbilia brochopaga]|nr:hypothetical protein ABW21_db0204340 [Drechslerella brochopaga]
MHRACTLAVVEGSYSVAAIPRIASFTTFSFSIRFANAASTGYRNSFPSFSATSRNISSFNLLIYGNTAQSTTVILPSSSSSSLPFRGVYQASQRANSSCTFANSGCSTTTPPFTAANISIAPFNRHTSISADMHRAYLALFFTISGNSNFLPPSTAVARNINAASIPLTTVLSTSTSSSTGNPSSWPANCCCPTRTSSTSTSFHPATSAAIRTARPAGSPATSRIFRLRRLKCSTSKPPPYHLSQSKVSANRFSAANAYTISSANVSSPTMASCAVSAVLPVAPCPQMRDSSALRKVPMWRKVSEMRSPAYASSAGVFSRGSRRSALMLCIHRWLVGRPRINIELWGSGIFWMIRFSSSSLSRC